MHQGKYIFAQIINRGLDLNPAQNFMLDTDGYLVMNKVKAQEVKTKALTMDNTDQGGLKTIGNGVIEIGATSTVIMNQNVATSSKIFITWRESLAGADWWICRQNANDNGEVAGEIQPPLLEGQSAETNPVIPEPSTADANSTTTADEVALPADFVQPAEVTPPAEATSTVDSVSVEN